MKRTLKHICVSLLALLIAFGFVGYQRVSTVYAEGNEAEALKQAYTKEMDYYDTQNPEGVTWVTNADAAAFLPEKAKNNDVTCAVKSTDGAIWIGTNNGLMRMDLSAESKEDIVQYFSGTRYLYQGNDHVTALAADDSAGVWVQNANGSVHIRMVKMSMQDRTYTYEKLVNDVNDRRGMVTSNNSFTHDPLLDEYYADSVSTSDNDGLWTAMYAMGEIYRYQTLKQEGAPAAEVAAAKKAAMRAVKAVLLLDYISGRANGFPCRSYMLKSEAGAQLDANGMQIQNGFWFEMRLLEDGEAYPEPIIDEMKSDQQPIGIATVRITRDALQKRGSKIFADDTDYNGLGLSASAINTFNTVRAAGSKLGTDIVSFNGQVYPVMVDGVNYNVSSYTAPTTPITDSSVAFRLTVPIYERIPQAFNELFPDSVIGDDGYIDESQIVYKADTSSDEVDGHYALFLTAYEYLCDEESDQEVKDLIVTACSRMTDLILKDDHYYIVDATGKSTQWSRWLSRYFNDGLDVMKAQSGWSLYRIGVDESGEDALSYGYEDGPLNALEVMAALKIAAHICSAEGSSKAQTYELAYNTCFESPYSGGGVPNDPASFENGKGYMDMALEYVERRIVRQNTDAYGENGNTPVTSYIAGDKIFNNALHEDWTQYVNYSDEELGWFPILGLISLETDTTKKAKIVEAFDQWYDDQEEREDNPFYTFLYQMAHPEKDVDLTDSIRYFYRMPLIRDESLSVRADRQDILYIEAGDRDRSAQSNRALTKDEARIMKNNSNPFNFSSQYGESINTGVYADGSGHLDCGTVFTLSYWLGRFNGLIKETGDSIYSKVYPNVVLSENNKVLTAAVTYGGNPLSRVIVDFYADGKYIGRARTDDTGKATLDIQSVPVGSTVYGQTTERLIHDTVYYQQDSNQLIVDEEGTHTRVTVTYNAEQVGGESNKTDSTAIKLTFDKNVKDLKPASITLSAQTGNATMGTVSGQDNVWTVALSAVGKEGTVRISIAKWFAADGTEYVVEPADDEVTVFKKPEVVAVVDVTMKNQNSMTVGDKLELEGAVLPDNATYQNVTWVLVDAGNTGAELTDNILQAAHEGVVKVKAVVKNGNADGSDFEKVFEIKVMAAANPEPGDQEGVNTGDANNLASWISLLALTGIAASACWYSIRRKNQSSPRQ